MTSEELPFLSTKYPMRGMKVKEEDITGVGGI
jgi:hypothetical protein